MIIGIMGQARAGKDTMAEHLVRNYRFARVGLADPMKRFCKEVFDFSDAQLYGDERDLPDKRYLRKPYECDVMLGAKPAEHLTPRYALQTLGTEWGRDCYRDIWIEYGLRVAKQIETGGPSIYYTAERGIFYMGSGKLPNLKGVVFSDLRFRNEFNAVKKAGGKMIRIYRPEAEGKVGIAGHPSEEEQKTILDVEFDHIIQNDGSIDDFGFQIDRMMERFNIPTRVA